MNAQIGKNLEKLFSLENKVVVLTGATGGIGAELAKGLAAVGGIMALCDIDEGKLNDLKTQIEAAGGRAYCYLLDVTKVDRIKTVVDEIDKELGGIHVLINSAGVNKREGILDVEEQTYDRIMDINLKGTYFMGREVAFKMMKGGGGAIVNVGSHNSVGMLGGVSVYGATKSGVAAITRSQAIEWAKFNIRSNCIAPGHILTPLTTVTWEHPERSKYLKERIAMGRPGNPEELLGLVVLLSSDASSYMSGMMYHIDGGCLAGGQPWPYDTKY